MRYLFLMIFLISCKTDTAFQGKPDTRKAPVPKEEVVTSKSPDLSIPLAPQPEEKLNPTFDELSVRPRDVVEDFIQESSKATADILIVIDDSRSMKEEQTNLSTKMNALLKSLADTDWQIGVITTTAVPKGSGFECRLKLIGSKDTDANSKFASSINAGIGGSGNEQGILQAVVGLKCPETPWVRQNSTLAVLIVSDEDNCSDGGESCRKAPGASERYLTDYVEKELGRMVGINVGFFGIYSPPGDACKSAASVANTYQRLIDYRSQGQKNFGKICDASYQSTLERISDRIADLLKNTLELKEVPIAGSVKIEAVKANGQPIDSSDFSVAGRVVGFKVGSEPMKGTKIIVSYQVPGTL